MTWRVAKSLTVLLNEVNDLAPGRSRLSDGAVGDAAHASRSSDHNPWVRDGDTGVVTARDITHDPARGCDAGRLAEHFRALGKGGDGRVKYVIWDRRIASFLENWRWREYAGRNPHTKHVHLSVSSEKRHYDSTKPWGIAPRDPLEEIMASHAERAALARETADLTADLVAPRVVSQVVSQLTPALKALLARASDGLYIRVRGIRAVFQVFDGVRVWIDPDDYTAAGRPEVQEVPSDDPLMLLRLVGQRPPAGS
jgi:hypothetical protein